MIFFMFKISNYVWSHVLCFVIKVYNKNCLSCLYYNSSTFSLVYNWLIQVYFESIILCWMVKLGPGIGQSN